MIAVKVVGVAFAASVVVSGLFLFGLFQIAKMGD